MKYNTVTSFEDYKTFTCDTQDFVYPAVVEEHKEKHGEDAILLVTTPKAGARGANLIAYGKDAINLFRLFGEYTDEMNEKMKGRELVESTARSHTLLHRGNRNVPPFPQR